MSNQPEMPFPINASQIVPRIKTKDFNAGLSQSGMPADQLPITEPLVGNLVVSYAFDLPQGLLLVRQQDLAQLGIPADGVRKVALENLKKQMPQIVVDPQGTDQEVLRIVTGGQWEACTLLANNFWKNVTERAGGEVVASAPSRDVVLYCSAQSPTAIATLAAMATEIKRNDTAHGLSDELLVWRGGGWDVFR